MCFGKVNRFVWMGLNAGNYVRFWIYSPKPRLQWGRIIEPQWFFVTDWTLHLSESLFFFFIFSKRSSCHFSLSAKSSRRWIISLDGCAKTSALRCGRRHECDPARTDLSTKRATCSTLVSHFNMLSFLDNERGSGGGSHCRDHWSSLSENLYSS